MSSINPVSDIMSQYGIQTETTTETKDVLGKDAFLELLATQMQYQDPLQPTSNEQFLAQMAQFSALEQMQNLNTSFAMQQGYDLVGKSIIGKSVNAGTGETSYIEGAVESVTLSGGKVYLNVGEDSILLENVEAVVSSSANQEEITSALEAINSALTTINDKLNDIAANTEPIEVAE